MCTNMIQCFARKEVRELGMTLVINARKKPPSLHFYKALLMAQVKKKKPACTCPTQQYLHSSQNTHTSSGDDRRKLSCSLIHR